MSPIARRRKRYAETFKKSSKHQNITGLSRFRVQEILNDDGSDCGRIPRTLECELLDDLVNSVAPGENVTLSGILAVSDSEEGTLLFISCLDPF